MKKLKEAFVKRKQSIRDVMLNITKSALGTALVVDDKQKLQGIVTDGDIRRAILKGVDINEPIESIMNKNPLTARANSKEEQILNEIRLRNIPGRAPVPIVDEQNNILDLALIDKLDRTRLVYLTKHKLPTNLSINRILVIGGAGYLGSVLVRKLLDKGYKVRVLDNLTFGDGGIREFLNNTNFELYNGDIRNIDDIVNSIIDIDAVIHLAGIVGDPASSIDPISTVKSNVFATKMVAEICKYHQISRFIFASTCSVYGIGEGIVDEESNFNPVSLYARSKIDSEKGLMSLADDTFFPTIFRMATLYGFSPRMRFDLVLNLFCAKAVEEKEIQIFGGDQWRPLLHVNDAAEAYVLALEAPLEKVGARIFNLGSTKQNYKIRQLGTVIKENVPSCKICTQKSKTDTRSYQVNFDKIKDTLGFAPKVKIKDAILEIVTALKTKKIGNYNLPIYNNHNFLRMMEDAKI